MDILTGLKIIDKARLPHPEWEFVINSNDLDKFYNTKDYVGWTVRTVKVQNGSWVNIYANWIGKKKVPETIDDFQRQHNGRATFVVYPSWKWEKGGTIIIEDNNVTIEAVRGAIVNLMRYGKVDATYQFKNNKLIKIIGEKSLLNTEELDKILLATKKIKQNNIILEWGFTTNNNFIFYRIEDIKEAGKLLIDKYNKKIPNKKIGKITDIDRDSLKIPKKVITGTTSFPGNISGRVVVIKDKNGFSKMKAGMILVAPFTTPDFVPLFKLSKAVVTDLGGITSHAAIVCRELKIPCVVGTQKATSELKDEDIIKIKKSQIEVY